MKEILYKAKDIEIGEWVYGNYVETIEEMTDPAENCSVYAIIEKTVGGNRYMGEYSDIGWHKIDKATLCEYTGLTDKNGKMIFTNDIVLSSNRTPCYVALQDFEYIIRTKYRELKHRLEVEDEGKFEVVGNMFDNPELLEKKQ